MTVPSTCCGRTSASGTCACAQEATCSCGKQPALQCNCEKAATENTVVGSTCACGKRASDACTCKTNNMPAGTVGAETDFTTKK